MVRDSAATAAVQGSIEERVRALGPSLKLVPPRAMIVVLAGAALWPVAAPLLGTGVAVGAVGGVMGLLGGPGQAFISRFLDRAVASGAAVGTVAATEELRSQFERELLARLQGDSSDAAELRSDVARLLRGVGGVHVALSATARDVRETLARGLAELGTTWSEFAWVLGEVQGVLAEVQARQAESLVLQRAQLDLQREQLVKTNLLLHARTQLPAIERPRGSEAVEPPAHVASPYKGLAPFQPDDAELFFGRERLVAEVLARLAETPLLAVMGASGSGKSSMLRAGVVRALWEGVLTGSSRWPVAILTPTARPLDSLAMRVALVRGVAPGSLLEDLRSDPAALALTIEQALLDEPPSSRFVLVVDQLEELFTLCGDDRDRRRFLDALLVAARRSDSRATVLLAVRSDVYGALGAHPGMPAALRDREVLVGPMDEDELRRAIELPATHRGLTVAPDLAELLIRDIGAEPGALPLLSHALHETWRRREGRTLTVRGYVTAGGVQGAIALTAEEVFARLTSKHQLIARRLFLRLTALGDGTVETRRRATLAELLSAGADQRAVKQVVGVLVGARLLISDEGNVEVAHEALVRHWPRLRTWLDEDRASLHLHRRLTDAAHDWLREGQDQTLLYRGARLAGAREWATVHSSDLNPVEQRFLELSARAELDELAAARRRSRRLQALAVALAALLLAALGSAGIAVHQSRRAEEQRRVAQHEADVATSRRLAAEAAGTLRTSLDVALLAGLEAYRIAPTVEAHSSLLAALQRSGRLRVTLRDDHTDTALSDVAFMPDGRVISADAQGVIRFWNVARGTSVGATIRHGAELSAIALSAGHRSTLASAGSDGTVKLWDLHRPGAPATMLGRRGSEPLDVAFAPDATVLAATHFEGPIRLWDVLRGRVIGSIPRRGAPAERLAFSPDGGTLATTSPEAASVELWNVADRRHVANLAAAGTAPVVDVAFGADGTTLAWGDAGGRIHIWDWRARRPLGDITHGRGAVTAVAFDPTGRTLASAGVDGIVRLWDVSRRKPIAPVLAAHAGAVDAVAFSPAGTLLASAGVDGSLRVWDARRGIQLATRAGGDANGRLSVALSADGSVLAAGRADGTVEFWDAARARRLALSRHGHGAPVMGIALSAAGRTAASVSDDGRVQVWDSASAQPAGAVMRHGAGPKGIALSGDGRLVATAGFDPAVRLGNVAGHGELATVLSGRPGFSVAFSPEGGTLAAGLLGGRISLWDTARGRRLPSLGDGGAEVVSIAFRDGRMLASGDRAGAVELWDVAARRPLGDALHGHSGAVLAVTFVARGHLLASAGADRTVRLWDVGERRALGPPLKGHRAPVQSLAVTPSGRLASSDDTGAVLYWDALITSEDTAAWRDRVCRLVGRSLTPPEWSRLLPGRRFARTCSAPG